MQEVFEKIIEKLEEEKSKVPVNRVLDDIIKDKPKELGQLMAYSNSVKIVKQVAEEYNNHMISVNRWKYTRDEKPNSTRQVIVANGSSISHYGYYLKKKDKWYTDHRCDLEIVEPTMWTDMPDVPEKSIPGATCN